MVVTWYEQSQSDIPAELTWLNHWERTHISRLRIPKRRADWLLGRWTMKRAVAAQLSFSGSPSELARIEIWPEASGAPRLFVDQEPSDLNLSVSHCGGIAACLVGSGSLNLGCDIEAIEPRTDAFVADYFSGAERAAIEAAAPPERYRLITLFWSAKESALKALRTGLRVDTRYLTVTLDATASTEGAAIQIATPSASSRFSWRPLRIRCANSLTFSGSWCWGEANVRTAVLSRESQ